MSYPNSDRAIENVLYLLKRALSEERPLTNICTEQGKSKDYVKDYINKKSADHAERDIISPEEYRELIDLHEEYKSNLDEFKRNESNRNKKEQKPYADHVRIDSEDAPPTEDVAYDAYQDDKFDDRSIGEPVRDEDDVITLQHSFGIGGAEGAQVNRITGYRYHIMIRDEEDLVGELTREEMETIYKLYSSIEGAGLTQRSLSRYFNNLTLRDLKRILRAFNITKQSAPVPPHIIEEYETEKVLDLIYKNKEDHVLKKIEEDKQKRTEAKLREKEKENIDLKSKLKDWRTIVQNMDVDLDHIDPVHIESKETEKDRALVVYLSDQHVGAMTEEDSLYENEYNASEFHRRMNDTLKRIIEEAGCYGRFDELIVCNLGDCVDGYNEETTRGGHTLSQNMNNKQQFNTYIQGMFSFFENLHHADVANHIRYYSVGDDNHSGDVGYMANKTLEHIFDVKYPDMHVQVFEKFIDYFYYGDHAIILSHGKDKEFMKSGFPLTIDNKTENHFNDYITNYQILKPFIHVVMGDLHQTSVQDPKRFRYKRVLSMYGASKFIHTNHGSGKAGVEYDIIEPDNNNIRSGVVKF